MQMMKTNTVNKLIKNVFFLISFMGLAALQGCGGGSHKTTTVTFSDAAINEGETGTTDLVFSATISPATTSAVSVQYATADGTATAGTDYAANSGTLNIPAGSTSASITITLNGDTGFEADEIFTLNLSNATGVTLTAASVTGTITNDDNADPKGYFTGTATVNTSTALTDLIGLVYNKRLLMFSRSGASNVLYDISISNITGENYTATANVYVDGNIEQTNVPVTSGLTNESQISGSLTGTGLANGAFSLLFDTQNNVGASLGRIEASGFGRWSGNLFGIDVDAGSFASGFSSSNPSQYSGGDDTADFCAYSGNLIIPGTDSNIYQLAHDVVFQGAGTCDTTYASTNHTGFASVIDTTNTDDTLAFAFANGTIAVFAVMNK